MLIEVLGLLADANKISFMVFHTHSPGWLGEFCRSVSLTVVLLLTPVYLSAETEIPVLTTDTELATAGYYQLSWQPGIAGASYKKLHYELQQASDKTFSSARTIYSGPDQASVISGRENGAYYYRVRTIAANRPVGQWSKSVLVTVQHHSLQKAWLFFIAGVVVFALTLVFIVTSSAIKQRG